MLTLLASLTFKEKYVKKLQFYVLSLDGVIECSFKSKAMFAIWQNVLVTVQSCTVKNILKILTLPIKRLREGEIIWSVPFSDRSDNKQVKILLTKLMLSLK